MIENPIHSDPPSKPQQQYEFYSALLSSKTVFAKLSSYLLELSDFMA